MHGRNSRTSVMNMHIQELQQKLQLHSSTMNVHALKIVHSIEVWSMQAYLQTIEKVIPKESKLVRMNCPGLYHPNARCC